MVLNVYFRIIDDNTLPILEALRSERYKSINYWINPDQSPTIYIRDYKNIHHTLMIIN